MCHLVLNVVQIDIESEYRYVQQILQINSHVLQAYVMLC